MNLILPLKKEYFLQIQSGVKTEEYRLCTDYWKKRLVDREYESIILTLGYPKSDDMSRRIVLPWRGYEKKLLTHPHFGEKEVEVYAIKLIE